MMGSTPAPRLTLAGTDALYVTDDDLLLVTSFNAAAGVRLTLGGRLLRRDGQVVALQEPHTPNTDRTAATSIHKLAEGWLQSLTVVATGTLVIGQAYVRVDLVRGTVNGARTPIATLIAGGLTAQQRRAWPGGSLDQTYDGAGAIRSVAGTNPAAGVEISETVPAGARWRLESFFATLVTDATAANREVALVVDDGTNVLARVPTGQNHAASLTRNYSYFPGGEVSAVAQDVTIVQRAPAFWLLPGYRIRTITTNLQAADDWSAPRLGVLEQLEAA
jgi:hypothetical protein